MGVINKNDHSRIMNIIMKCIEHVYVVREREINKERCNRIEQQKSVKTC